MDKYGFLFVIDIRGTPYGRVTLGAGSFLTSRNTELLTDFRKIFPEFKQSRNKGCVLKKDRLKDIIEFLEKRKVHMVVVPFSSQDWKYYKDKYVGKGSFKEKIMGCLYFKALKKTSSINRKSIVVVDNDSWMDVSKALAVCQKIAKANNYDFDFSIGRAIQNDLIRIVDYIASSYDRLDKKFLLKLNYYHILGSEISSDYLSKIFK
jgi:hypothetical protein